jgi:hypothetical protein
MTQQLEPHIKAKLLELVAAEGKRGIAGLAERISKVAGKVSRASLSTMLTDRYPGDPTKMRAKILVFLGMGELECPFLRRNITETECRHFRTRPQPTSNATDLRHWVTCQSCSLGCVLADKPAEAPHAA